MERSEAVQLRTECELREFNGSPMRRGHFNYKTRHVYSREFNFDAGLAIAEGIKGGLGSICGKPTINDQRDWTSKGYEPYQFRSGFCNETMHRLSFEPRQGGETDF